MPAVETRKKLGDASHVPARVKADVGSLPFSTSACQSDPVARGVCPVPTTIHPPKKDAGLRSREGDSKDVQTSSEPAGKASPGERAAWFIALNEGKKICPKLRLDLTLMIEDAVQDALARLLDGTKRDPARLRVLKRMPYKLYLQTPEWAERREQHLRSAKHRCQVCNGEHGLNVHHRTYERRGEEAWADLIVLCRVCHKTFHGGEE